MGLFDPTFEDKKLESKRWQKKSHASFEEFLADAVKKPHGQISESDNASFRKWFLITVCILFAVLISRVGYLQIARGAYYRELAEENRVGIDRIAPIRGLIYDRYGEPLVSNVPSFDLAVVPDVLPNNELATDDLNSYISNLKKYFSLDSDVVKRIKELSLKTEKDPVVIRKNVDREKVLLYRASEGINGVTILESAIRNYLKGDLLPHTLGYTGSITAEEWDNLDHQEYTYNDVVGKTGIELYYEETLRGKSGENLVERDNVGNPIKTLAHQPPQPGHNIILTLDSGLQEALRNALQSQLDAAHVSKGAAVAIDPRNGEVLALVSLPGYDLNIFIDASKKKERQSVLLNPNQLLFHRAVAGTYPPGSTFKPTVAAAALSHGNVTTNTTIYDTGTIEVGGSTFRGWLPGGHGLTDVYRAIAQSVNGYFYAISGGHEEVKGMGIEVMAEYVRRFGYGEKTGIDLPTEASGLVPDPEWKRENKNEEWYIGDTYNASIGQGFVLASPLQVAYATAIISNGGSVYQPHLVKEFRQTGSQVADVVVAKRIRENIATQAALQAVREGMRQAVTIGTARRLGSLPVTSGGKTGTAQAYSKQNEHAWFTAFAPYENPQIAIAVVLEKGGEGSEFAAPVAYEALRYYFTRTEPTYKEVK
ncbi:penicillin-binding protein 2 [Patescibacteria group bacterium]